MENGGGGGGGRHNARKLCSLLLMLHNFLLGASWLPGEMRKLAEFSLLIYCEYVKLNIHFTLAAATMLCGLLIFYCLAARFALFYLQWFRIFAPNQRSALRRIYSALIAFGMGSKSCYLFSKT